MYSYNFMIIMIYMAIDSYKSIDLSYSMVILIRKSSYFIDYLASLPYKSSIYRIISIVFNK